MSMRDLIKDIMVSLETKVDDTTIILFKKIGFGDIRFNTLVNEAKSDKFIGDVLHERDPKSVTGFFYNDILVGFAIPRKEGDGYRTGPIFVKSEYRNKGIAKAFVKQLFDNKKGNAYIEENNIASQRLFLSCGFTKQSKSIKDGNIILFLYSKK